MDGRGYFQEDSRKSCNGQTPLITRRLGEEVFFSVIAAGEPSFA